MGFNFLVEVDELLVGGFSEVSGLQAEIEVHDYREGGVNEYIHRRAGPVSYKGNLVLKRGVVDADKWWEWCQDVLQGTVKRQAVSIILRDASGDEVRRWNFKEAYPVRWVGPNLQAGTAAVAVETIELAHHGFDRSKAKSSGGG